MSGGRNAMPGSRTKTKTVLWLGLAARWFEHTPENTPFPTEPVPAEPPS